jgi:fatty-acyl-CoA synthase
MNNLHHPHWPRHLPHALTPPHARLEEHLEVSARRYPDKAAFVFYGSKFTYRQLHEQVEKLAGYLQQACGLQAGERVLLQMQNCPQFVAAYYAVLRAGGVVVPANPMYRSEELRHLFEDTGARIAICGRELEQEYESLRGLCTHLITAQYRDALPEESDVEPPELVRRSYADASSGVDLKTIVSAAWVPRQADASPEALAMLLYSSGTTGRPKGCMHSHSNLGHIAAAVVTWMNLYTDTVLLMTVPLFHIAGMQNMMIAPILAGATVVICARWDRDAACVLTDRHAVTHWTMMPTMVIDLLSHPKLGQYSLKSVRRIGGGGAAMPDAISEALEARWGVRYLEGYGLSESGHVLNNPPQHPKRQCLGIPLFGVDARVVEVGGTCTVPVGAEGEILVAAPYLFLGYWNDEAATRAAFVEIDGRCFLRTGDLGRIDEEGYFFIVDRLKRMVNASGFKVWPAEVESMLYAHPAVLEACVISTPDPHRGETVKAVIALRREHVGSVSEEEIVQWSRERMAAFKYPRIVEFVDSLPKTATGKVDWRALQERERAPQ